MQIVPLSAVPSQSLSFSADQNFYEIVVRQASGIVAVNIIRNSVALVSGMRAVAGNLILPYKYLQNGNFFFQTAGLALPAHDQFGTTQNLIYLSPDEIQEIMDTPQSFLQYGAFPIRYKPNEQFVLETESGLELETEDGETIITG